MKLSYTRDEVERWRDRVYRRTPRLAVRTKSQAHNFVRNVGFCFAFKSDDSELPCLWHAACGERDPTLPKHTHRDPHLSFVWEMKDVLPAEHKLYYGRVLRRRPTLISMELFPYFYSLSGLTGTDEDYVRDFKRGGISLLEKTIMDTLIDSSPQVTRGLKLAVGKNSKSDRIEFDRAIADLQAKMYIVKIAEHYSPFTFEWGLVQKTFRMEVRRARRISVEDARNRILQKYFENQLISSVPAIVRLFGWKKNIVYQTLGNLMDDGVITANVKLDLKDSKYYCLVH